MVNPTTYWLFANVIISFDKFATAINIYFCEIFDLDYIALLYTYPIASAISGWLLEKLSSRIQSNHLILD
jgi:hypothetical protein